MISVLKLGQLVLACLLVASTGVQAWAMGNHSDVVRDQYGRALGGATIWVYSAGTTDLAEIYSDNGSTPKSNPMTSDTLDGRFNFYAANGVYDLVFSHPSATFDAAHTARISVVDGSDLSGGGGGSSSVSLDGAFDVGNRIDGATSARPLIWGNGTQQAKCYGDATLGTVCEPDPLGDSVWRCWTNFNCVIRDEEAAATMFTIDPDAASPLLMYQFSSGYRPLKSGWIGAAMLDGDGTNCPARPTVVTINSGPKLPTFICSDSSSSILYGAVRMPDDWDGGTITFQHVYIQTAADTNAVNGDVSAQCHGNGETVDSTWGTSQPIDDAAVTGSNKNDMTTSAAVTPAGTCAAGDMLYFRYVLDATGTTTATATLHHLGFYVKYTSTSWSH